MVLGLSGRSKEKRTMRMCLNRESLENLLDYLVEQGIDISVGAGDVRVVGCDHTRRHSTRWLQLHGFDVDEALALLTNHGGCCCDCEMLFNVDPEAIAEGGGFEPGIHHRLVGADRRVG